MPVRSNSVVTFQGPELIKEWPHFTKVVVESQTGEIYYFMYSPRRDDPWEAWQWLGRPDYEEVCVVSSTSKEFGGFSEVKNIA